MTFNYESMLSPNKIAKIKTAIENKFQYYDPQLKASYYYSVPVGFERDIVLTTDNKVIFNNYDHTRNLILKTTKKKKPSTIFIIQT